jgi:hypothetical protein
MILEPTHSNGNAGLVAAIYETFEEDQATSAWRKVQECVQRLDFHLLDQTDPEEGLKFKKFLFVCAVEYSESAKELQIVEKITGGSVPLEALHALSLRCFHYEIPMTIPHTLKQRVRPRLLSDPAAVDFTTLRGNHAFGLSQLLGTASIEKYDKSLTESPEGSIYAQFVSYANECIRIEASFHTLERAAILAATGFENDVVTCITDYAYDGDWAEMATQLFWHNYPQVKNRLPDGVEKRRCVIL